MGQYITRVKSWTGTHLLGLGMHRRSFVETMRNLDGRTAAGRIFQQDKTRETALINILGRYGLIKAEYAGITSFSELQEGFLSVKLTQQRLNEAFSEWQERFGEAGQQSVFAEVFNSPPRGRVEGFADLLWKYSSIDRADRRAEYNGFAWRTMQALRALHYLAVEHTKNDEITGITRKPAEDWYEDNSSFAPNDVKVALEGFLSSKDGLFASLSEGMNAIAQRALNTGLLAVRGRYRAKVEAEIKFYQKIADIFKGMKDGQPVTTGEVKELLDEFEQLEHFESGKKHRKLQNIYNDVAASLREIIDNTENILKAPSGSPPDGSGKKLFESVRTSYLKIFKLVSGLSGRDVSRARALSVLALTSIFISIMYIVYRIRTTRAAILSGAVPPSKVVYAAIFALLAAEIFFNALAIFYQSAVLHGGRKAIGEGWYPQIREGLEKDPAKRPFYAFLLTMVDEPISAILPNTISHVRACWEYGPNAKTFIGGMSTLFANRISEDAAQNYGRVMSARKSVIQQLIESQGIESGRADRISIPLASEKTEIDDPDCRYTAMLRVAEIGQRYNISQRTVRRLGQILAEHFEKENQGATGDVLKFSMSREQLVNYLIALEVDPLKVDILANLIFEKIDSLFRKSTIARLTCQLLQGKTADDGLIARALVDEYRLTEPEAVTIVGLIKEYHRLIKGAAEEAVGKYDFSPTSGSQDHRRVFGSIYEIMAQFFENDERYAVIASQLSDKIRQIVQNELYEKNKTKATLFSLANFPALGTLSLIKWKKSKLIADEISQKINGELVKLSVVIDRKILETGCSYLEAEEAALEIRRGEIKSIVEDLRDKYGLTAESADKIAGSIIDNIIESYSYKKIAAEEFASQLAAKVEGVAVSAKEDDLEKLENPSKMLEFLLKGFGLNRKGDNGREAGAPSVSVTLLIQDNPKLDVIKKGSDIQKKIETILESTDDPAAERSRLIAELQKGCKFSKESAEELIDAYIAMYARQVGKLKEIIPLLQRLIIERTLRKVNAGEGGLRQGDILYFGDIPVDMKKAKETAEKTVEIANVSYRGGDKAGVVNTMVWGSTAREYLGELARHIIMRMTGERIFGRRYIQQEVITLIDSKLTGEKGLIPLTCDRKLVDADYIATRMIEEINKKQTPEQIARSLLLEWNIEKPQEKLIKRLIYTGREIQSKIALGTVVNELGGNPGLEVESFVERLDIPLSEKQKKVVTKYGKEIKENVEKGLFEIAGRPGNYYLKLTEKAERDRRVEDVLFEHYVESTRGLYAGGKYKGYIFEGEAEYPKDLLEEAGKNPVGQDARGLIDLVLEKTKDGQTADQIVKVLGVSEADKDAVNKLKLLVEDVRRRAWLGKFFREASAKIDNINAKTTEGTSVRYDIVEDQLLAVPGNYSKEEKDELKKAALQIRILLEEIKLKESYGAIFTGLDDKGRLVIKQGENLGVRGNINAIKDLERLQHFVLSPVAMTADQIAEDFIIRAGLPNLTVRKEDMDGEKKIVGLAVELRKLAPHLEALFESSELKRELKELMEEKGSLRGETAIKEVTLAAVEKIKTALEGAAQEEGIYNYLNEKMPAASTIRYGVLHIDDADYRAYPESAITQAPYITERKSLFMTGEGQYGRERGKPVGDAMQSGRNAYWGHLNIRGSLAMVAPSWGSCTAFSSRAYGVETRWSRLIPYAGRLSGQEKYYKGKFSFTKLYDYVGNKILEKTVHNIESEFYDGLPGSIVRSIVQAGRIPARLLVKKAAQTADLVYSCSILQLLDGMHYLASRGKLPDFIARKVERPVLKRSIIEGNLVEILGPQRVDSESEDIRSSLDPLAAVLFMNDGRFRPIFGSLFLEGFGSQGAHSDSIRGLNSTFYSRWGRGNIAILPNIFESSFGAYRMFHLSFLALFWYTGLFRPLLITLPLAFMFGGVPSVIMGKESLQVLSFMGMVLSNFGVNLAAFIASMRSRGFFEKGHRVETAGCLTLEFSGQGRMLKSVYEGGIWGQRPPFDQSPKKAAAIEKQPVRKLMFEYGLLATNLSALGYATYFSTEGGYGIWLAAVWAALHAAAGAYSLATFNRGVFTEKPFHGTIKAIRKSMGGASYRSKKRAKIRPLFQMEEGGVDPQLKLALAAA